MKKQRYRILFSKTDQMRFTGHLDLILTWERIFRRAGIPLAYSEGFSPRPLLNMATPLPLGFISTGEIGDFWLSEIISIDDFKLLVDNALPPGLELQSVEEISDLYGSKLPSLVTAARYRISFLEDIPILENKVNEILNTSSLIRERKGKSFDIRPLITELELIKAAQRSGVNLNMTLVTLPGATGRPDDVLDALNISARASRICRTEIILKTAGR